MFELYNYWTASAAIVGNRDASGRVLRKKRYRGPISLIPGSASTRRSSILRATGARLDGQAGYRLHRARRRGKGVDLLIDALAQVQPRPTLGSSVAGISGWARDARRAARNPRRGSVRGAMPPERVPDVLRQLDILALPSPDASGTGRAVWPDTRRGDVLQSRRRRIRFR
ncbi:MAG: hypothetical protein R2849_12270 [Thermomicrobiales bacterium]